MNWVWRWPLLVTSGQLSFCHHWPTLISSVEHKRRYFEEWLCVFWQYNRHFSFFFFQWKRERVLSFVVDLCCLALYSHSSWSIYSHRVMTSWLQQCSCICYSVPGEAGCQTHTCLLSLSLSLTHTHTPARPWAPPAVSVWRCRTEISVYNTHWHWSQISAVNLNHLSERVCVCVCVCLCVCVCVCVCV